MGDEVLAWNQATGENEPRRVVETFVHEGVETWEVETSDGQVVTPTAEHPFWVEGKGWTPVRELVAGDVLTSLDGPVGLVRVETTGETARVFNVHVDGLHNYHVGDDHALRVHNSCENELVDLASSQRRTHILDGDLTGGGHRWPGLPGKTPFPEGWSDNKIMHAISDIATDPHITWKQLTGKAGEYFTKSGKPARMAAVGWRDGVQIKVVIEPAGEGIVTAHPIT